MKRKLLLVALLVLAVLVSAVLHVYTRGRNAMLASDAAMTKGDLRAAIVSAKEAAQARLPLSPFPERGRARLSEIARDAESRTDFEIATMSLRALWAACASTMLGAPDACAQEAELGLDRIAARTGTAETPKEEPSSPPILLPLGVVIGVIALGVSASRLRK